MFVKIIEKCSARYIGAKLELDLLFCISLVKDFSEVTTVLIAVSVLINK